MPLIFQFTYVQYCIYFQAEWTLSSHRPARDWPEVGNVQFNGYCTRYRDGLELVLKGISCHINGGERVSWCKKDICYHIYFNLRLSAFGIVMLRF